MIPVARNENLLIEKIGDELIVYDQVNNTSHCLKQVLAKVWKLCNGQNTIDDIANFLANELDIPPDKEVDMKALVKLILEQLEYFHLIKGYRTPPITIPSISRRKVIKAATFSTLNSHS